MKIHQLLNIQGYDQIYLVPQSVSIVEAEMRKYLNLSIDAPNEQMQRKYEQLNATEPFKSLFEAYRQFWAVVISMRQHAQSNLEPEQVPRIQLKKIPRKSKECEYDLVVDACCNDNLDLLKKLLLMSPSYTFDHYFLFNHEYTTALKEAIKNNNIEMINVIIKQDIQAITKVYCGQKFKRQMCFIAELFSCEPATFDAILKHFNVFDSLKPSTKHSVKLTMFEALVNHFSTYNDVQKSANFQRELSILGALKLHDIQSLNDKMYQQLAKIKTVHEAQFMQFILPLFNVANQENIKRRLSISNNKNVSTTVPQIVTNFVGEQVSNANDLGEVNVEFWQAKRSNHEVIEIRDDEEYQPKKAKTDFWKTKTTPAFAEINPEAEEEALAFLREQQQINPFL